MKRRRRTLDAELQDAGAGDIIFFISFLYSCLIMSGIKFTNFTGTRSETHRNFEFLDNTMRARFIPTILHDGTLQIQQENLKIALFLRGLQSNELRLNLYKIQFPTFDACEEWALSLEHNVMVDKPEKHKHIRFCMRCQTRHRFGHHVVYKR